VPSSPCPQLSCSYFRSRPLGDLAFQHLKNSFGPAVHHLIFFFFQLYLRPPSSLILPLHPRLQPSGLPLNTTPHKASHVLPSLPLGYIKQPPPSLHSSLRTARPSKLQGNNSYSGIFWDAHFFRLGASFSHYCPPYKSEEERNSFTLLQPPAASPFHPFNFPFFSLHPIIKVEPTFSAGHFFPTL